VLTPTVGQIAWANGVIEAMAVAEREGRGAKDKCSEMVALVHIKLARKLLDRAASIGGKP
jgi:citrate lyase beta subunit